MVYPQRMYIASECVYKGANFSILHRKSRRVIIYSARRNFNYRGQHRAGGRSAAALYRAAFSSLFCRERRHYALCGRYRARFYNPDSTDRASNIYLTVSQVIYYERRGCMQFRIWFIWLFVKYISLKWCFWLIVLLWLIKNRIQIQRVRRSIWR